MHVGEHGGGGGGVAGVAGDGLVEGGFGAVEAGDGVAEGAGEPGDGGGAAEAGEEDVGGGVVAFGEDGVEEVTDGHLAAGVRLGEGGVGDEGFGGDGKGLVERVPALLLVCVGALEDGRGNEEFDGGAHGEALVGAMGGGFAGAGIEDGDAEAGSVLLFEVGEGGGEGLEATGWGGCGAEGSGGGGEGGGAEETAAGEHAGLVVAEGT